jgi:5-methyltetrahydropteroyltriglutamate--homocysteine methyltransferase
MQRSTNRILTTHVGSLIRPDALLDYIRPLQAGDPYDIDAYEACLKSSVADIVQQQAQAGLDVVSDGEFGKSISWSQYALERLSGFEKRPMPADSNTFAQGADRERFAEFYDELDGKQKFATVNEAVCVAPIEYTGLADVKRDIDNFKAALGQVDIAEGFLPVAAPSSVIPDRRNEFYANEDDCLEAIGKAMQVEYNAIVDAGLLLQLDDARATVTYDRMVPPGTFEEYRDWVAKHVDVLNLALEGIPPEKVRYHVCWGSWPGPHTTDVALKDIVDLILQVNAGAYVIEGANPRHEHEWKVWADAGLPEDKILIHGVISHSTNVVEHPELVAERIVRVANLLGRERVIAGTDCGFAQGPFYRRVHPSIVWAKFDALVQGAEIASKELWG